MNTGDGNLTYLTAYVGASVAGIPANTTDRIQMWQCKLNSGSVTFTDWHTQDKNGNIVSVYGDGYGEGNARQIDYAYDSLGRLTRENNNTLNKTIFYSYDAGGNILSKKEYAYTQGNAATLLKEYLYTYRTSGWKDQLLSWDGKSFAYDNAGNPTTYKGESMAWTDGRRLSSYTHNGTTYTFTYDGDGQRKTKTYAQTRHTYDYVEGRLVRERKYVNDALAMEVHYVYDSTGIIGFVYNGMKFYYRKNVQGDVIGVMYQNYQMATYTYDAWGNCTIVNELQGVGHLNPFRYRGYYYDEETGLYYLMTRYYDPEIGRFVNADDVSYLDPETLNGLNLYAYCLNNPVMGYDPTGHAPWWSWLISGLQVLCGIALCFIPGTQGAGVGLIFGGTLGLISNAVSPAIAQAIGGASSIANGWGAVSTGISLLGLGVPGIIGGIGLMLVGGATMAFGANEIVAATTGTNYIQQWTGMSDTAYGWIYFGLNLTSSIGQMVGTAYYLQATRVPRLGYDGQPNGYRYKTMNGKMYDFDYPHGNVRKNHYHGWAGPGLHGRVKPHWGYLRLLLWLFIGR